MGFKGKRYFHSKWSPPTSTLLALLGGVIFGMLVVTVQLASRQHDSGQHGRMELPHQEYSRETAVAKELQAKISSLESQLQEKAKDADKWQKYAEDMKIGKGGGGSSGDRHALWSPSADKESANPELAEFLKKVAINGEVMVAVSNINYATKGNMVDMWIEGVRRAGVKNAMVIALDDDTKKNVEEQGFPVFRMEVKIPDSQKDTGSNHAVSAMKFRILTNFVKLGYSVLLSDVDIVILQNPFDHLKRDSDVEAMSDGWDPQKAYGYNHVDDDESMGWSRYSHTMRVWMFNSGFFYLRATKASLDLLNKIIARVESEKGWDQAIFNEVIFMPSRPGYEDPSVTRRVLDYTLFANSKTLFKFLRKDAGAFRNHHPVIVHVNYHPDKYPRMKAVIARYVNNDLKALDPFSDGS